MICMNHVMKTFKAKKATDAVNALYDVSLNISSKETVAVVGRSGAGKSTLLHVLGGISKPTGGNVLYQNEDIYKFNDKRLSQFRNQVIGFVFQDYYLENSLTALENVILPLQIRKIPAEKRMQLGREALEKVGLEQRMMHKPEELSGGEKQRVCIARAIVTSPAIIVADEPTGNLDEANGRSIMDLLLNVSQSRCLIVATHDPAEAARMDCIISMADGKVASVVRRDDHHENDAVNRDTMAG